MSDSQRALAIRTLDREFNQLRIEATRSGWPQCRLASFCKGFKEVASAISKRFKRETANFSRRAA